MSYTLWIIRIEQSIDENYKKTSQSYWQSNLLQNKIDFILNIHILYLILYHFIWIPKKQFFGYLETKAW